MLFGAMNACNCNTDEARNGALRPKLRLRHRPTLIAVGCFTCNALTVEAPVQLRKRMNITMCVGTLTIMFTGWLGFAQSSAPTIKKEMISVHEVHRGTMPLSISASGFITSVSPPRVTVTFEQ
jgi:hypothetical protein